MSTNDTPRIYVACLACYNEGRLHGTWIDATQDADDIDSERAAMQQQCGHTDNDWAIHDFEGFGSVRLGESEPFSIVSELAQAIEEHGGAAIAFFENFGNWDADAFSDAYLGEYASVEDWAAEFLVDSGQLDSIPEDLRAYFDLEKWARDVQLGGDIWTAEGGAGVFVFWNH